MKKTDSFVEKFFKGKRRVRRRLNGHIVTVIEPLESISIEEALKRMAKITAKYSKR